MLAERWGAEEGRGVQRKDDDDKLAKNTKFTLRNKLNIKSLFTHFLSVITLS